MEHIYSHTKQNPYVCGIDGCQELFKQKSRLCVHRKQCHQYSCQVGSNAKKKIQKSVAPEAEKTRSSAKESKNKLKNNRCREAKAKTRIAFDNSSNTS